MRFDAKLNALQRVIDKGQFNLSYEGILNNQYVKIQKWNDVCTALRVLREVDWLSEDSNSRLLDDYLENRGEGDSIEVPAPEFQALHEASTRIQFASYLWQCKYIADLGPICIPQTDMV